VKKLMTAALLAAAVALAAVTSALADDAPIKVGTVLDFTSFYALFVPQYSQGQRDYVTLVNGRGGVGGHSIELIILDHGNDVARGIEAYQRVKNEGAVLVDFLSTPVSRAVVPMALADGMNVLTLFHGRADAADGLVFPTIFPAAATYWSQAADIVKYIEDQEIERINGKRIALVALDNSIGHEAEQVLEELSKRLRFKFAAFYYKPPGADQAETWKEARRFAPDWTLIWGAGIGQAESVRQAIANGFKLDHVASNINIDVADLKGVDAAKAKGLIKFEGVASGRDLKVIAAIEKEVIAPGKGAGPPDSVGTIYYNAGVTTMVLLAEAARLALASEGEPLTPAKLKKGFEQLRDFTADDLMAPVNITARDHQGGGRGRIVQWSGDKWIERRHWFAAYQDIVWDLILKDSAQFKATGK
jgi:branched-chain amino acid transport system substrate-binding protein